MSEPAPSAHPEPSPFQKMTALAAKVMSVPKSEVDKREAQWREERAKTTAQRKLPRPH